MMSDFSYEETPCKLKMVSFEKVSNVIMMIFD